ncbi:MAG: hypothetical protein ACRD1L_01120 [Terriglobales bacterium]
MSSPYLSRREFSRAAVATLAGGTLAGALGAQAAPRAPAAPHDPATAEVAAKVARILALYGDRLNPEQRQRLQRTVAGHVAMLGPVRAVTMPNSDPPATVLGLVRGGNHD